MVNKAVWENTGLIPKFYKPYSLIETQDRSNPVPLYRCHFCKLVYKGHNSIVYHCRRHIGDYPYKCEECGFVEVFFLNLKDNEFYLFDTLMYICLIFDVLIICPRFANRV